MANIVMIAGALANRSLNGGAAWTRLSWLLGFRKLGFEVYFIEEILPAHCVDDFGSRVDLLDSINLGFYRAVLEPFGMLRNSALLCRQTGDGFGLTEREVLEVASDASCLINISGHLGWEDLLQRIPLRVYLDLDPGFTQGWDLLGFSLGLENHNRFYTIGENIGSADCSIPTGGRPWKSTRQPFTREHWPPVGDCEADRFTTVSSWRGPFGKVTIRGKTYGLKAHAFRQIAALPRLTGFPFEIALDIDPAETTDLDLLKDHDWLLVDPRIRCGDPVSFRRYVQGSLAEFSVAQGVYSETRSGWFSDRSVRYLASGKPVLIEETGFRSYLGEGPGVVSFRNLEEAVAGARSIRSDYEAHCQGARRVAEEYFDSDRVIGRVCEQLGVFP